MKQFYNQKLQILISNKISNPELDLKLIINNSLFKNNYSFISNLDVKDLDINKFNNFFSRRIKGEPISKILNKREFWSLNFYINKYVLDPRPETELILEGVIKHRSNKGEKFLACDLGTGSGCIIISFLKDYKKSIGIGVDISQNAIKVAKKNCIKHKLTKRLNFVSTDWRNIDKKFDIIFSNPPYIKIDDYHKLEKEVKNYDPKTSLLGGYNGLKKFLELGKIVYRCMKKDSIFILEIGYTQKTKVEKIFYKNNLFLIDVLRDLQGIERVLVFKKKPKNSIL